MLKREGHRVKHKKFLRFYRDEELTVLDAAAASSGSSRSSMIPPVSASFSSPVLALRPAIPREDNISEGAWYLQNIRQRQT